MSSRVSWVIFDSVAIVKLGNIIICTVRLNEDDIIHTTFLHVDKIQ